MQEKTRKTSATTENPARPQIFFCHIQSNIIPTNISITYTSSTTQNLSDLYLDIRRSLKVEVDDAVWLPIYDFLLLFHTIWPLFIYEIQAFKIYVTLTLTFQGLDFPYMIS